MATNDFFLNFGSNAKTFASGLSGELKPATESISSLTAALERYDAATNNRKSNGPLDSLFTRLDAVSEKFADLTGSLASTFETAIRSIGLLQQDIAGLLSSVQGVTREGAKARRGRNKIDAVDDSDVQSAAALRNRQALRVNTTAANKQLDRLADINGRLAPRIQEAADKVIILGSKIGELQGASHRAIGGLDSLERKLSHLGEGVVINTPTGAGTAGPGATVNPGDFGAIMEQFVSAIRGMTLTIDHANIQSGRVVQQAQQIADSAPVGTAEARQDAGKLGVFAAGDVTSVGDRYAGASTAGPSQYPTRLIPTLKRNGKPGQPRELEIIDHRLDEPARSAWPAGSRDGSRTFALGNRPVTFKQGDLVGDETFAQHFARMEQLDKRFRPVESRLPTGAQVDPHGDILEKVSKAFWTGGGVHQTYVTRNAERTSGQHALTESISANPTSRLFNPGSISKNLLEEAEKAGLGMVTRNGQQEFDHGELVKQALALTSRQYIPGQFGVHEGTLPNARASVLKDFIRDELKADPRQTFSGLGSTELTRARQALDENIVQHHEDPAARINPTLDPALREHFREGTPEYAQLVEGARARLAADKVSGEVSSNIRAVQSARREFEQRRAVHEEHRNFKEDSGLGILADRGSAPANTDTSITAERLNQQYALATQISHAKERRDQTQAFLDKEILRRASLGRELKEKDPAKYTEHYNKATENINNATGGIETANANIEALEEQLSAMRKSQAAQRTAARETITRYQEITKTANEAREELQNILKTKNYPGKTFNTKGEIVSTDAPRQLSDSDAFSHLGLMDRFGNIKGTTTVPVQEPEGRLESLQAQLAASKALLERAKNDPQGFAAAAIEQTSTKAVTRQSLLPAIQERLRAAEQELAPGVQEEQRLKDAALKARAAQEARARAKGVPESEIQAAVARRNAQRAADPGRYSPENLAAENRYRDFVNQRQEAEAARQAQLEDLRQKAYAAREKKEKNLTPDARRAAQEQRNLERLVGGGYSPSDLPAERAAIKARLSTPEGRLEQAQRELRSLDKISAANNSGVLREARTSNPESVFAVENAAGKLVLPGGDKGESPMDRVKRTLTREIESLEESVAGFGHRDVLPKLNDEQRQEALRNAAQARASTFVPLLEKYGVPDAHAVAMGPTRLMEAALIEAATKMDEAASGQQKAADKAEAAQDKADGFKNTTAQRRAAGRDRNEGVRFAPRLDEDGNVIEGAVTPRQQRRAALVQRNNINTSVPYSQIVPGTESGPQGSRLGAFDLTKMMVGLERTLGKEDIPSGRRVALEEQLGRASVALKNLTKAADEAAAAEKKVAAAASTSSDGINPTAGERAEEDQRAILRARNAAAKPLIPLVQQGLLTPSEVASSQDRAEQVERTRQARARAANIAGEAADATAPRVSPDLLAEKELLESQHAESLARKRAANAVLKKANTEGTATDEMRATSEASNAAHRQLNQRINSLNTQIAKEEAAVARATEAASGGGGGKPPRPPKKTGGTADGDGEKTPTGGAGGGKPQPINPLLEATYQRRLATFSPETQEAIAAARRAAQIGPKTTTLSEEQQKHILDAAHVYRQDPEFNKIDRETARRTLASGLGLPRSGSNQRFLIDTFKPGGLLAADPTRDAATHQAATGAIEQMARVEEALAIEAVKVREALLGQIAAEERLAAVRANPRSTPGQIARAERGVSVASRQFEAAKLAEENPELGGIGKLLQHGGQQAVRFASFQIAFTGIEKVRELVDTGIQAQTQFIRLQSNLEATHRSATGLMQALGDVSSQTAQPLAHTIQAASELTGVLKTRGELIEGSKIASELANISHGMLTATQAAIGLRDVTDAYGLSGIEALRGVGDMIAKVSQVTGVSVHDVIEGTTQLAQEAHSFGLGPRQAAVLAAEVTKNTGESGEAAAEQVSRILSTFNNGKVQQLLAKTVVPELNQEGKENKDKGKTVVPAELFNQPGGIGTGLTRLLSMYDQLAPAQQHAIDALVGTGRQARALTGLLRDAATAGDLLNKVSDDQGALASQNARFLQTLGGAVQKLGADFRNLGADLMQAHVFDILMVVVGAVDKLMTTVDFLFRQFDRFNENPLTKSLLQMLVVLGEVSLAFKVFGGTASAAFGMKMARSVGLGGFFTRVGVARTEQAEAAAASGGSTFIPFGRSRAMGTAISDTVRGGGGRLTSFVVPTQAELIASGRVTEGAARMTAGERMRAARGITTTVIPPTSRLVPGLGNAGIGAEETEATAATRSAAGVAAGTAAQRMGSFARSIAQVGGAVAGPIAAFALLEVVMHEVSKAMNFNADTQKMRGKLNEFIGPESDPNHGESTDAQKGVDTARDVIKRVTSKGKDSKHWWNPTWHDMWQGDVDVLTGNTSKGNTSNKFNKSYDELRDRSLKRIQDAAATGDPKKVAEAQKEMDKDIADHAKTMEKSAGDKDAQAVAAAEIAILKQAFDQAAIGRASNLAGIADFDQLTLQQLENMQGFVQKMSSLDTRTIRTDPEAFRDALDDTGVSKDSRIGKAGLRITSGEGALARAQDTIEADKLELPQLDIQIRGAGLGTDAYTRLTKARDTMFANLQQQMTLVDQLTIQNAEAFANILSKIGNNPAAVGQLGQEVGAIKTAMTSIGDPTDPTYLGYLGQLADKNQQKADLEVQPQIDAANLHSARNPNRVSQATDAQTVAQLRLDAARKAAGTTRTDLIDQYTATRKTAKEKNDIYNAYEADRPSNEGNAEVAKGNEAHRSRLAADAASANAAVVAASKLIGADATEKAAAVQAALAAKAAADIAVDQSLHDQASSALALKAAYAQATGQGQAAVDAANVQKANEDVTFATKEYGAGSTEENNAKIAALQAVMTQKQDAHDQATSGLSLQAAIQANAGDTTGAARSNLAKANSDVSFAVKTYGRDSKQANDARAAAITANANLQKEIDDALNASLDLEISMLSNRGNDSDKRKILDDKVQQAQNNLNAFTAKGGKKDSPEGKRLTAQVNDAKRNRVDQGVQIQVDTLDYMRQTFQISTAAEINALKDILKNKQLTQDRVRQINLQIRQLAQQISGQFNIGDIVVPTFYQARRSASGGYDSAPTTSAVTTGYGQTGGSVITNSHNTTTNIKIDGADMAKVMALIKAQLGTTATTRYGTASRKGAA